MRAPGHAMKYLKKTVTPTPAAVLAVLALLGPCIQANAQTPCPELVRLRADAQEALKESRIAPPFERCYAYNRSSQAWDAVVQFARDNPYLTTKTGQAAICTMRSARLPISRS
jgi:ElaB/YqjD/DUF883 family membrane-anchored ribosome-binding protein